MGFALKRQNRILYSKSHNKRKTKQNKHKNSSKKTKHKKKIGGQDNYDDDVTLALSQRELEDLVLELDDYMNTPENKRKRDSIEKVDNTKKYKSDDTLEKNLHNIFSQESNEEIERVTQNELLQLHENHDNSMHPVFKQYRSYVENNDYYSNTYISENIVFNDIHDQSNVYYSGPKTMDSVLRKLNQSHITYKFKIILQTIELERSYLDEGVKHRDLQKLMNLFKDYTIQPFINQLFSHVGVHRIPVASRKIEEYITQTLEPRLNYMLKREVISFL